MSTLDRLTDALRQRGSRPKAAKLACAKDRHRIHRPGQKVAELTVSPADDGLCLAFTAPNKSAEEVSDSVSRPTVHVSRPTAHGEKASRVLEAATKPLSFGEVDRQVAGEQEHVAWALDVLVAEGCVTLVEGSRRSKLHTLTRPYRQADGPAFAAQMVSEDSRVSAECVTSSAPINGAGKADSQPSPGDGGEIVGRRWGTGRSCDVCEAPLDAGRSVVCDRCTPVLAPEHRFGPRRRPDAGGSGVTRPTPIPVSAPRSLNSCAAVVDDETGEHLGWVLPDIPERAPLEVREGVTVRRLAALHGRCPACGAPLVWSTRRQRRRAAAGGRAPAGVPHIPHRPTCAGHDQLLDAAIARWQGGGAR